MKKKIAGAVMLFILLVVLPSVVVGLAGGVWYLVPLCWAGTLLFGGLGWLIFFSGGRGGHRAEGGFTWFMFLGLTIVVSVSFWLETGHGWEVILAFLGLSVFVGLLLKAFSWVIGEETE